MKLFRALSSLGVAVMLTTQSELRGQPLTVLHQFSAPMAFPFTNSDGTSPQGDLAFSGSAIYGTTGEGGLYGAGEVYAINLDGTGFRSLHHFATLDPAWDRTNTDGFYFHGVLLSSNTLFGSTVLGGTNGQGTIFSLNTDGSGFNLLHTFSDLGDGAEPGPILKSGPLVYGTAFPTFFSLNPGDPIDFTVLTNQITLTFRVISADTIFGTAAAGGDNGAGFVFSIKTNASNFTVLHSFGAIGAHIPTNADGFSPVGLILSGNTLFGLNYTGGTNGQSCGTVYSLSTDGTGFKVLHAFTPQKNGTPPPYGASGPNWDGGEPVGNPVVSGHTLYGVAQVGGAAGNGTLFCVNTNGDFFTVLHTFSSAIPGPDTNYDGACPTTCSMHGGVIYGTTHQSGLNNGGTLFSLAVPAPKIQSIQLAGTSLTLGATGGIAGGTYALLSSPDPSVPFRQWTPIATNTFDETGSSTFAIATAPNSSQSFFVLQMQ